MSQSFNYRHLYYFWVVAKEGGIARAAERLDMAAQTISAQVRELEKALGVSLLRSEGRNLVLTDADPVSGRLINIRKAATRLPTTSSTFVTISKRWIGAKSLPARSCRPTSSPAPVPNTLKPTKNSPARLFKKQWAALTALFYSPIAIRHDNQQSPARFF